MIVDRPILRIDAIEVGHQQVSAELRIGPRRELIALGFQMPGMVRFQRMPAMLENIPSALTAVIDLLSRAYRGEVIPLPVDLSQTVRDDDPEPPWLPWPLHPQECATDTPVTVVQLDRDPAAPEIATVHVRVGEAPAVVMVDRRGGNQQAMRFRFLAGVHPWQLDDGEAWMMLIALVKATAPSPAVPS